MLFKLGAVFYNSIRFHVVCHILVLVLYVLYSFVLGHPFSLHHGLNHHVDISSSSSNIYNIINNSVFIVFNFDPCVMDMWNAPRVQS